MEASLLVHIYATIGFLLAAYSVVANDSVQILGTFIASNSQNGGDISYGNYYQLR